MSIGPIDGSSSMTPITAMQSPTGTQQAHRGGHHHHSAPPVDPTSTSTGIFGSSLTDDQQSTLDSLSSLLGTDPSTLTSSLQSGTSLSSMLADGGVSQDDAAAVLQNGLMFDASA